MLRPRAKPALTEQIRTVLGGCRVECYGRRERMRITMTGSKRVGYMMRGSGRSDCGLLPQLLFSYLTDLFYFCLRVQLSQQNLFKLVSFC